VVVDEAARIVSDGTGVEQRTALIVVKVTVGIISYSTSIFDGTRAYDIMGVGECTRIGEGTGVVEGARIGEGTSVVEGARVLHL